MNIMKYKNKPDMGVLYKYISILVGTATSYMCPWQNTDLDNQRFNNGNCYPLKYDLSNKIKRINDILKEE